MEGFEVEALQSKKAPMSTCQPSKSKSLNSRPPAETVKESGLGFCGEGLALGLRDFDAWGF